MQKRVRLVGEDTVAPLQLAPADLAQFLIGFAIERAGEPLQGRRGQVCGVGDVTQGARGDLIRMRHDVLGGDSQLRAEVV